MNNAQPDLPAFTAETLKSPGPYFMAGNALVNWETNPALTAVYAATFAAQTILRRASNGGAALENAALKFVAGPQGALASNAGITLGVSGATLALHGSPWLAGAALAFGAANMGQALIYGGAAKVAGVARNFALAACEVGMIGGFMALGVQVGLPVEALATIAGVGGALAGIRSFAPKLLHPDLAYADMLITAGLTLFQAVAVGDYTIAASRVMAMVGVSRLAVARAKNDKRTSVFALESHVPAAAKKVRAALRFEQ